jgi:multimeric flavodoxin WrbA
MLVGLLKTDLEKRGDQVMVFNLYSHLKKMETIYNSVDAADTIVICGPCYVNTYPADTTKLLEDLASQPGILHGQNLYGIIQGGMPYAHTHVSGLNMLKVFSRKVNVPYRGGFVMGMGAALDGNALNTLPNGKKVERQLMIFFENIHNGEESPDSVYESALIKLPGLVARVLSGMMNRRIDKKFAARGMDAHQPSPYLSDKI